MAKTINDLLLSNYHCLYFNHRCVNKDSWEKAEKEYPNFAKEEERLQQFLPLKIKSRGEIPKPFSEYCQVAVNSTNRDSTNVLTHTLTRNGHRCDFIQASYQSISKCMVKQKVDDFQGASLIIAECTSDVSYSIWLHRRSYIFLYCGRDQRSLHFVIVIRIVLCSDYQAYCGKITLYCIAYNRLFRAV